MNNVKYLIIGAGMSGLSFANFIPSDDFLILEASDKVGGYCKTFKKDGFTWDYSGHFFHFNNKEIKDYIFKNIDEKDLVKVEKITKIHYKDTEIDFPFQKNIHQLPKEEFIECLYDLFFKEETVPTNFKEMLMTKFGKGICEKFLFPYNEKLYACDLNKLDVDAMGRFFPYADVKEIIKNMKVQDSNSYNSTFIYSRNGAIEYVDSLMKNINNKKVHVGERLLSVDVENKTVKTNKGEYRYEYMISSIPFDKFLSILDIGYNREVLQYNKVLVFNLGFDKPSQTDSHWVYFPGKETCFYRVGFYDNILQEDRMSLYVELGFSPEENIDIDYWRERVLTDLKNVGVVTNQKLISEENLIMSPAYVHVTKDSNNFFSKISKELGDNSIYSIGRYGGWKYCSIEDNIIEAKELVNKLKED